MIALSLPALCSDILFNGAGDTQDDNCPILSFDLDGDVSTTALDLSMLIDYLFAGGPEPCDRWGL